MITKDMTLADVVKAHPNTIGFLNGLHLDYCCGGHEAISIAIREKGMDVEKFLAELNEVAARPTAAKDVHADSESFKDLKVTEMLDDLEATHHVTDRRLMAETEDLLNKILIVHYPHHGEMLTRLHHLYAGLKAELEEHFAKEVKPGDFVVAGRNFGTGSSREHAVYCLKEIGVPVVLAENYARIYYRNAINNGYPVLFVDGMSEAIKAGKIQDGDDLEVDLSTGRIRNVTKGTEFHGDAVTDLEKDIMAAGGLIEYLKAQAAKK